jgi:predicted ATP-dependent serine protease
VSELTPIQIFELSTQGLLEVNEGALQFSKKASRGENRSARKAAIETIRPQVTEAVATVAGGTDRNFRLDDVLKATGLDKATHRDNILQCLRDMREEGILESVKTSDNNFQIFWKLSAEALS